MATANAQVTYAAAPRIGQTGAGIVPHNTLPEAYFKTADDAAPKPLVWTGTGTQDGAHAELIEGDFEVYFRPKHNSNFWMGINGGNPHSTAHHFSSLRPTVFHVFGFTIREQLPSAWTPFWTWATSTPGSGFTLEAGEWVTIKRVASTGALTMYKTQTVCIVAAASTTPAPTSEPSAQPSSRPTTQPSQHPTLQPSQAFF
jgi:hypothetical protein